MRLAISMMTCQQTSSNGTCFPYFFFLSFGWLTIARIYGVFGEFSEPLHPVYIFHFSFTVVHETSTFEDDFVGARVHRSNCKQLKAALDRIWHDNEKVL